MTCSGPFGKDQKEVTVDKEVRLPLVRGDEYSFSCVRKIAADHTHYPTVTLTARTQGADPLLVTLPRENVAGGLFLGELEKQVLNLSADVENLKKRRLICSNQTMESAVGGSSPNVHWIEMTARVPATYGPEWLVTGGGCQIRKAEGDLQWSYIGNGNMTSDQRGWYCSTEHVPGHLSKRSLIATVIFCNSGI
jgi:hypothetical protein